MVFSLIYESINVDYTAFQNGQLGLNTSLFITHQPQFSFFCESASSLNKSINKIEEIDQ